MSWYITLLACGLFLIGLEIFVPGGVLGVLGAAALIAAVVIGFTIFPPWLGWLSLVIILSLTGLAIYLWMKYLPQSPIGKALSLSKNLDTPTPAVTRWKPGMTGTALCDLRPAGKALIDGQRADVVAENSAFITRDTAIEVVRVSGAHLYVKETQA